MTEALSTSDKRRLLRARLLRKEGFAAEAPQRIPRRAGTGPARLSFGQQRLWFLHQLDPVSPAYNLMEAVHLRGDLDGPALQRALAEVVRRHEALRTTFPATDGEPVQAVQPWTGTGLPRADLAALPEAACAAEMARLAGALRLQPFDLARGPLFVPLLLRLGTDEHVLVLGMHHAVSDGWSMGLLVRELTTLYAAGLPSPLPELPIQYPDFAEWQRGHLQGEVLESHLRFWRERLAGAPTALELPADRPRPPVQTFHGRREPVAVPAATAAALREVARACGATPFMALAAAFGTLLLRATGQEDLLIGTPVAGRNRPEIESLIGFFVNTLVLRLDLAGDPLFQDLLPRIRAMVMDAGTHQDLPFEKLVDALDLPRDLSRSPLFQVVLTFQNLPAAGGERPDGLALSPYGFEVRTAQFDLHLILMEGPRGIEGDLEYRTDLFDPPTAQRFARRFEALVAAAAAQPLLPLSALPLLSAAEAHQVEREWNDTLSGYPELSGEPSLHGLVAAQERRTPGAVAVTFEGRGLTWAELGSRARALTARLRALGCGPESRVGIAMERSAELMVALLGTLEAGAAYVPLDPDYPRDRLAYLLEDSRPAALLTQERLLPSLPPFAGPVLCLDAFEETAEPGPEVPAGGSGLAYVIYTSGSTGRPKGAMVHHRAIVNRLVWMQDAYRLTPADTVLQKTPFSFDVSVWELFWPLLAGARLVLARPGGHRDPAYLAGLIRAEGVTVLHFVPSMLQAFLEEADLPACRTLRLVVASGEALPAELARRCGERLPAARLENLYGPTEAAVDVTRWSCAGARTPVPIGRPIANTRIHLLDTGGRTAPLGVPGELCIGGLNVGRAYLDRSALTAERFVPDPYAGPGEPGARLYRTGDLARTRIDGAIEYLGRIDHQVKVRGFRIELGEVESVLAEHPEVREAVVLAREDGGTKRLVAYIVPAPDRSPSLETLRRFAAERLPDYMLLAACVRLDALPLSPNGKLDRRALPAPDPATPETAYEPPATAREEILASLWAEVLGLDRVGALDNFFALGGDSILSIRLLSRVRQTGMHLTLQQLFQHQTVRDLARAASLAAEPPLRTAPFDLVTAEERERMPAGVEDAYPLSRLQAGMLFHSELTPESAVYHDIYTNHLRAPFDSGLLRRAFEHVVTAHPVLRTSFDMISFGEPLQLVQREVGLDLEFGDLRALDPGRQEEALAAWTEEEKRRPFEWACAPLARFRIDRRSEESFQLSMSFHHAILDGWSVATLMAELFRTYLALLRGDEPPALGTGGSYRQFVALERQAAASEDSRRYWRDLLAGARVSPIARWHPLPGRQGERGAGLVEVPLPPGLSEDLRALSRASGLPLKSVLLAAHSRVLSVLSGSEEVVSGMVSNGRLEEDEGERVLGLFLNTPPVRLRLAGGTWRELARQAFEAESGMLPHRRYPMVDLQREMGGRPLYEAAFGYVHFHIYQGLEQFPEISTLGGTYHEEINFTYMASFNLDPFGSHLLLRLQYDRAELHPDQMSAAVRRYEAALASFASAPDARYEEVALLLDAERRQLLDGAEALGASDPPLLHRWFEATAARRPNAEAVRGEGQALTYGELDRRANRLARFLVRLGVGPESRVALCVGRSPGMVVGLLGILKAGAAYVPLDPDYPSERLAFLLADCVSRVLVTEPHVRDRLPAAGGLAVVDLEADRAAIETESGEPLPAGPGEPRAGNAAYVIYTSGSTGRPKGVVVTHGNAARLLTATEPWFGFSPDDVWTLFHSSAFDFSVWEVWGALAYGGRLVVVPFWVSRSPDVFLALLESERVTVLNQTPSAFRQLVQAEREAASPRNLALRWVIFGGEALDLQSLAPWFERHGDERPRLVNMYGITETTVHVTWRPLAAADLADGSGSVVGVAIPDLRTCVLDGHGQLALPFVPGEIHVAGRGLSRGYLGRPDLTAERFVPDPWSPEPGGRLYRTGDLARALFTTAGRDLEHLGRVDQQVKVRGFRIEPGEIEAALARHPAVAEARVVAREGADGDRLLAAYLVPRPDRALPVLQLLRLEREGRTDGRPLHELPNGMPVFHLNRSETEFLYREIFLEQSYLHHGIRLEEDACIFDVGANIGLFSVWAARHLRRARYYIFEPIPQVCEPLRLNTELYGLDARVFECGLAAAQGRAELVYYPHVSVISGRFADAAEEREVVRSFLIDGEAQADGVDLEELLDERLTSQTVDCELKTLSQVIAQEGVERIDLLKIDVEKSEMEVLAGLAEEHWPRVRQVAVEVHDLDGRLAEVTGMLERRGFRVAVEQDAALRRTRLYNVFAVRPGDREAPPALPGNADERFAWSSLQGLVDSVRAALQDRLPDYMVPSALIPLDHMPLTVHGKLDVRALPAPGSDRLDLARPFVAPRTPTEELLARIWAEALALERVSVDDEFLEVGGHSLVAMQLVSRIRSAFQIDLPLRAFYETGTIARLAEKIENIEERKTSAPEVPRIAEGPVDRAAPVPLTDAQEVFWIGHSGLFDLGGSGPNVYIEYEFPESAWTFAPALEQALQRVVARHELLRTVVLPDGRLEVLAELPACSVGVEDLSGWPAERVERHLEAVRDELRYARPAAGRWPLFEIVVHQLDNGRVRLHARFDALLMDGHTRGLLVSELIAILNGGESALPALEISYLDWARAIDGFRATATYERCRAWWMDRLPALPPPPRLPLARDLGPETVPRIEWRRQRLLEADDWLSLRQRAAQEGLTPAGLLTAAFAETLTGWCAAPRFTLGVVGVYRPEVHLQISRLLGTFTSLHLLAVEGGAGAPGTFRTRARRLQQRLAEDLEHRHFPGYRALREWNRRRGCGARALLPVLFDSIVDQTPAAPRQPETEAGEAPRFDIDLTQTDVRISLPQVLLLCVTLEGDDGRLDLICQAVEEVLPAELVPDLLAGYRRLLERLAREPESWDEASPTPPPGRPLDFPPEPLPECLGYSADPRRIEAALAGHPEVREAAVAWREGTAAGGRLLAWLAAPEDRAPSDDELRRHLRACLPAHLVPDAFVRLEALPRTAGGDVDLAALPVPPQPPARVAAGWDEVEAALAGLWEKLLGRRPESSRDDFFALGGDSLQAVRLLAQIAGRWSHAVPVADLFARPTLEGLARVVRESAPRPSALRRLGGWLRGAMSPKAGRSGS